MISAPQLTAHDAPLQEYSTWQLYWMAAHHSGTQPAQEASAILQSRGFSTDQVPTCKYRPISLPRRRRTCRRKWGRIN